MFVSRIARALLAAETDSQLDLSGITGDIILSVSNDGIIEQHQFAKADYSQNWPESWVGKKWHDVVTVESRPKIDALLNGDQAKRGRQVNHPIKGRDEDLAVLYQVLPEPDGKSLLAFGRDLSSLTDMQNQIVRLQFGMEREYTKLRAWETRFRVLAESIIDPLLIVDANSHLVQDHNQAALSLFPARSRSKIIGRSIKDLFVMDDHAGLITALNRARSGSQSLYFEYEISGNRYEIVSTPFRQDTHHLLFVRFCALGQHDKFMNGHRHNNLAWSAASLTFERLPDGIVTTGMDGLILAANEAFLELTELSNVDQIIGASLNSWLGRSDIDLAFLISQLRQFGKVKGYRTNFVGNYGTIGDVEITAAAEDNNPDSKATFVFRDLGNRAPENISLNEALPHSAQDLTKLIGRVPLKELVRQTTDVIEKLCIESALKLTSENRASAAGLLGLSRQGFYVKLRRYGMIDEAVAEEKTDFYQSS